MSDQLLREDVTPSGVTALRMAADSMPLSRPGQPWAEAAKWLHRRADGIEQALLASSAPATASEGATEKRDKELAEYLGAMDSAGGGIYTPDFRDGFRHALAMLAAYESEATPDQIRPEVREAARIALSLRATGVTSSDGERGLSEEVEAIIRAYGDPVTSAGRDSLRDAVRALVDLLAARTAQPDGVERVEWGVRHPQGIKECRSEKEAREAVAEFRRRSSGRARWDRSVVMRRAVTPWEVVGDE